jgi:hypothetical protein
MHSNGNLIGPVVIRMLVPTAVYAVGRQQPLGELTIHAKWRRMQQHSKIMGIIPQLA